MNAKGLFTVTEASRMLGLSAATVKRRLVSGKLTGRKETRPQGTRWLVEVDTARIKIKPPLTDSSRTQLTDSSELTTLITVLQEELTARREEIRELLTTHHEEIQQLHTLLAQQTALNSAKRPWWRFW